MEKKEEKENEKEKIKEIIIPKSPEDIDEEIS